jgi:hypothetical protein
MDFPGTARDLLGKSGTPVLPLSSASGTIVAYGARECEVSVASKNLDHPISHSLSLFNDTIPVSF